MDRKVLEELLQTTHQRHKTNMSQENSAYNILSAIGGERDETHIHSKIIYFLLDRTCGEAGTDDFLHLFLREIKVPAEFLGCQWRVCREQVFEGGRIDFVIESEKFCVAIEMKIDAADGERQVERYDSFCRRKGKEYAVYYLTPNGSVPDKQSVGSMKQNRLHLISFQHEILNWLKRCMDIVDAGGYRHSFLKQYSAAVRQISEMDGGVMSVKDLVSSADMAKAALMIQDSFYKKMTEVTENLFGKMGSILEKSSKLETCTYSDAVDIFIDSVRHKKKTYYVFLGVSIDYYLYACLGFIEESADKCMTLADAEKIMPQFYNTWMARIQALDLPKPKQSAKTIWWYIENTRGEKFNFKEYSDSVLELIDEMDIQCQYISETLFEKALKPLVQYNSN